MGSKTRLGSYCTNRGNNTMNLVTSHKTIARLARPIKVNINSLSKSNDIYKIRYSIITPLNLFYMMINSKCRALIKATLGPTHNAC